MTSLTRRLVFGLPLPLLATHRRHPKADVWNETQLYFGTSQPGGGAVNRADFDGFIDTHVTPRFPDGLTLLAGDGQFNGEKGLIKEKSYLLILFYPQDMKDADKLIEEIREAYKTLFFQESVLRADSRAKISF